MLNVETIRKVRQAHFRDGKGIREIARDLNLARNTVKRIIRSGATDQVYERSEQPRPKLGSFIERLTELLKEDVGKPVRHRKSAQILFEQLQREGYEGGYDTVRRYVGTWKSEDGTAVVNAFIPLEYDPGDAFQFDWSYEPLLLNGSEYSFIRVAIEYFSSDCIFYLTFSKKYRGRSRNYPISLELRNATYQTTETTPKKAGVQAATCPDCKTIQDRKHP